MIPKHLGDECKARCSISGTPFKDYDYQFSSRGAVCELKFGIFSFLLNYLA